MAEPLTWRNVSTPRLRDFIGYDGDHGVARIYKAEHSSHWSWSVYAVVPARPGVTQGHEADPKEARCKVEAAWAIAKANGVPTRTAAGELLPRKEMARRH
jgi:hypothetical protein